MNLIPTLTAQEWILVVMQACWTAALAAIVVNAWRHGYEIDPDEPSDW